MDQPQATDTGRTGLGNRLRAIATSPYLWGGAATFGFYQALPHLPVYRELAERYFCAHPVEYVQTALFFVGLCLLTRKLLCLRPERAALLTCKSQSEMARAADATPVSGAAAATRAVQVLDAWSSSLPASQRRSLIAQRCAEVRHYLLLRPSADSLETQLKDLEQRAGDELHDSFALVQTINWAIPIMGFLGTVLGITMAIFNLDVNHLDASLSEVTFNLAVAFDTTAVALCHSLILVFLYLFVKSSEERMLAQVAEFCRHVLPLVPVSQSQSSPLMEAEAAAAAACGTHRGTDRLADAVVDRIGRSAAAAVDEHSGRATAVADAGAGYRHKDDARSARGTTRRSPP
jgi:biopolymer transport protein ExbB/TolQ